MELIQNLKWRYATKKFDPTKKVNQDDIDKIKEVIQLSASSYGLQPYKVFLIQDGALREKLKPASWGQNQITDSSHVFVFCNYSHLSDEHIEAYLRLKSQKQYIDFETLRDRGEYMKKRLVDLPALEQIHWTARQTYIALGNLLAVCAELKIDACPMEGFDPPAYDEILGLSEKGLSASVVATIGYRLESDHAQHAIKFRKPLDLLFELM